MSSTHNGLVHFDQGGDSLTVESGGQYGACGSVTFVVGSETSSAIAIDITAKKPNGEALDRKIALNFHLSESESNGSIAATAASGGIAAGAEGYVVETQITGKAARVVTNESGVLNLVVTHTAATTYYPVITLPSGELNIGDPAVFA
jgi:hypothetical protein